jgi:20S proteasome subunit alpha 2
MSERYSFSLTTFSPSGKLLQIDYALNAVAGGNTSVGIRATNGAVIATEKKMPSVLVDETSIHKVSKVTEKIGLVYSGMGPDSRVLLSKAQKIAQEYFQIFAEPIPARNMVENLASVMQEYTQSGGVRPFGVSLLVIGMGLDGKPSLYQVDPSGTFFPWKGAAIGKNMVNAKTFLEKRYNDTMELEDAIHTAILTLKEGFEGQMTDTNIEIGIVDAKHGFRRLEPAEVKDYLSGIAQ